MNNTNPSISRSRRAVLVVATTVAVSGLFGVSAASAEPAPRPPAVQKAKPSAAPMFVDLGGGGGGGTCRKVWARWLGWRIYCTPSSGATGTTWG